jgi:uncharacterized membrane protein/CBS domain-containing protein
MRVSDIMRRDIVTLGTDATFAKAAKVLRDREISSLIVQEGDGPSGIITERDLVNLIADGKDPDVVVLADRMTKDLITIEPEMDADEAAHLMIEHRVRHLPVVSKGKIVGMVSIRDAIQGHPALRQLSEVRRQNLQSRVADAITGFAGSMPFVYVHVFWFAVWIVLNLSSAKFDKFPFGLLTMIVSLEAIFLSTFVMISQNRADEKRQALADHQWELVQVEEQQNVQLLEHSEQILNLTKAIHQMTVTNGKKSPTSTRRR